MSYDIYLFKKLDNKTVSESAETVLESDINALDSTSFNLQKEALSQKLKDANSKFEEFNSDDSLQLYLPASGLQIYVYNNQIAVTIPYWHTDKEAEQIFRELFNYLDIIKRETEYSIYDPQDGGEIKIDQGIDSFLKTYLGVSENLETIIEHSQPPTNSSNKLFFNYLVIAIIITLLILALVIFFKK